ncbi:hypothetical protein HJG60_012020 [Phyllostomus discolor]|uniref:Uncharacterized protein n=1 Tax=Phyllostomus discolor TaxID=89673 RepID=A0A833ZJ70_9CHIR|nr:hypothetical protein HJG60_012020 [Phyllostomus discolor]
METDSSPAKAYSEEILHWEACPGPHPDAPVLEQEQSSHHFLTPSTACDLATDSEPGSQDTNKSPPFSQFILLNDLEPMPQALCVTPLQEPVKTQEWWYGFLTGQVAWPGGGIPGDSHGSLVVCCNRAPLGALVISGCSPYILLTPALNSPPPTHLPLVTTSAHFASRPPLLGTQPGNAHWKEVLLRAGTFGGRHG